MAFAEPNFEICRDASFCDLMNRASAPDASIADFEAAEQVQIRQWIRGVHERYEAIWGLRESGGLQDEIWQRYRRMLRPLLEFPVLRDTWDSELRAGYLDPAVAKEIETQPLG